MMQISISESVKKLSAGLVAVVLQLVPAAAQSLAVDDLTKVEAEAVAALGADYLSRAEPDRLTLTCPTCVGAPSIDIKLSEQNDGTEERVRSGETTIAQLEEQCKAREPSCKIERSDVGAAVGWQSSYKLGDSKAGTLVLIRDGKLLIVRITSSDAAAVSSVFGKLKDTVLASIVGL